MGMQGRSSRGASYIDAYEYDGEHENGVDNVQLNGCGLISKHLVFSINFALLLFGVAFIVIAFLKKPELSVFESEYMVYTIISFGVMIIIYMILLVLSSFCCLSFIIFTQTSSSSTVMTTYSEHIWETFSSEERIEYESNHDCIGYDDECENAIREELENNSKLLNLVCIIVICIQMVMVSIGCILITKLSKKQNK